MSESETEHNALTLYAANYPARLQAASRQLAIAAQLNQDLERRRFVALLKRISAEEALEFFLRWQPLDCDLIERFVNGWDWKKLSWATPLSWSLELIENHKKHWSWHDLSYHKALP